MQQSDRVLLAAACLICVGVAVSGFVDFGTASSTPTGGTGTADVSVDPMPATSVTLARGEFGSGTYHLESPPGYATVGDVRGNPVLKLVLDVPELQRTDTTLYELHGQAGERIRLSFTRYEHSPKRVTRDEYDATIGVWLQEEGGQFTALYQEHVTVEVQR